MKLLLTSIALVSTLSLAGIAQAGTTASAKSAIEARRDFRSEAPSYALTGEDQPARLERATDLHGPITGGRGGPF